jgi:sugar lactone lactonase YvrE
MTFSGDGGPAILAALNQPSGLAVDSTGAVYIADSGNWRVRRVSPAGVISTVAGNGLYGVPVSGSQAASTAFSDVTDIAIDAAGNLYIADASNHSVRKVTPAGIVTTFAGTGVQGYSGDGGAAASANLNRPIALTIDAAGNLYICDSSNHNIRRVNLASGIITLYAGVGTPAFFGDGGLAINAALMFPLGVATDSTGNLYIADAGNSVIRKVAPSGLILTVAGSGARAGFSGEGGPASVALLNLPSGVAVDGAGNLLIADSGNNRVRRVDASGNINTIAGTSTNGFSGDGGLSFYAILNFPWGLAIDSSGSLYIADRMNNRIRKITGAVVGTGGGSGGGTGGGTGTNVALGKTATQSTTLPGYPTAGAAAAVDGNSDGAFFDGSVTATNLESNPWWQVDLGVSTTISSITVFNRTDCCGSRLNDYWVFVSDTPFGPTDTPLTLQFRASTWASHQTSAPTPSNNIAAAAQGRYVRVQLSFPNYLSLAEVQVYGVPGGGGGGGGTTPPPTGTNLAPGKTASQSSTLPGTPGAAAAVDNNTDGAFFDGSVTATNLDANAWWQLDLGSSASVDSITIWNRTDCCGSRLNDYWVFVSDTPFLPTDTPSTLQFRAGTWSSHQTTAPSPSATILAGTEGRYVRVQLTGTNYLSLAEVQVFGTAGTGGGGTPSPSNLALGKAAAQSSTLSGYSAAAASSAVDGRTDGAFFDGSVTATNPDVNAWWQVDLGAPATVNSIVVWNRTDCCGGRLGDYWVFVSNTPFLPTDTPTTLQFRAGTWANHQTLAPNPSTTIAAGTQGRYVRVQLTGADYLSLAEVQVIGQ